MSAIETDRYATAWRRADTDWFRDAKWGVCLHYLADFAGQQTEAALTPEAWNRRIDAVDVARMAAQIADAGAGYCLLTIGQNSGYFLSPNATYDARVGHRPSRCSQRDLVADLADALSARGVALMTYLPSSAPCNDRQAIEALQCTPPWDPKPLGFRPGTYTPQPGVDERLSVFQRHWEGVIREYAQRWGRRVKGWWFDGAYCADRMYRHPDEPNFRSFAAAAKAGHPGCLVAFNPGVRVPVVCHSEYEDYTAGEVDSAFPVSMEINAGYPPLGRYVNGAQYHVLSFLGASWGRGTPRFSDAFVVGYTRDCNAHEGVVTWDVPCGADGRMPEAFVRQLSVLRDATRGGR